MSGLFISFLLYVLNPSKKRLWNYRMSAKTLISEWIEREVPPPSKSQFIRALSLKYDDAAHSNEGLLRVLRSAYRWLIAVGSIQVTLWAALVWARG
jgi:hypothetical protein